MSRITWEQIKKLEVIKLYVGNLPGHQGYSDFIGLSINKNNSNHIPQDITKPIPLEDNTVDILVAEEVFEHLYYHRLRPVIDEIYRVLKPKSLFRISVPDYGCDVLQNRCLKDAEGHIVLDTGLQNYYIMKHSFCYRDDMATHVWFPRLDMMQTLLAKTKFHKHGKIEFLHYYKMDGSPVTKSIDHSKAFIKRTPDFDERVKEPYRPMSLVVDLIKEG